MLTAMRERLGVLIAGVALIGVGVVMIGIPLLTHQSDTQSVDTRGNADSAALAAWDSGGSDAVKGTGNVHDPTHGDVGGACVPGAAPADEYALVQFTSLSYNYAGVAGDGTWDLLKQRSMVHYQGTPPPGGAGNVIIAFHREPNYQYIDKLDHGGVVTIEDRSCHTYVYTIQSKVELAPQDVTQLNPTGGHILTMITCTPFWVDTDRLVWRGTLTTVDGHPAPA